MPDAEITAAEMVLREELAGRAETANLFHGRGRGRSASAEGKAPRSVRMNFFQFVPGKLVVRMGLYPKMIVCNIHRFLQFLIAEVFLKSIFFN